MEARLAALNLSHYAAALRGYEIDDDILKLMTVADLREAGLDPTAAQRLHANVSGASASGAAPSAARARGDGALKPGGGARPGGAARPDRSACRRCAAAASRPASRRSATVISFRMSSSISCFCSAAA